MAEDRRRADNAKQRRGEQLKRWLGSETDLEPPVLKKKRKSRVKFDDGAVFLAACSSGDTEEVKRLLDRGALVNYANVDGLTALHQACIDENFDMVKFLVEHGADTNQPDNEGWTPLHAVASCGYINIAEYLINNGAHVAAVNSEGEIPSDIAEESAMKDLLQQEISRQGIDVEASRKEEEHRMLQDARQWLNSGKIEDLKNSKSGGTALHVAAAKGYLEVLKLLIQAGYDINIKDNDGWTPLHAAAHWCKEEACRILVEGLCDMDVVNKVGQTPFDLADESIVEHLEELQKKQNILRTEKRAVRSTLIESTVNCKPQSKHLSKDNLPSEEKETKYKSSEPEKADEVEESKKDESSSSSSEEDDDGSDSESEADTEKIKSSTKNNINSKLNSSNPQLATTVGQLARYTAPTTRKVISPFIKPTAKEEESKDESPASWRLGLRKTGSHDALSDTSGSREALREKESFGIIRSASSPRLSTIFDNQEKGKDKDNKTRLVYVAPTIPTRRLHSTSDVEEKENRESAASLVRSGSYTRRQWKDDLKDANHIGNEGGTSLNPSNTNILPSYQRSASFGRRKDEFNSSSISVIPITTSVTSATAIATLTSAAGQQHSRTAITSPSSILNSVASTTINQQGRSYLTPVRDEEAESQRKARSRQARQTRRSTQGVTLTDLQEAEKTFSRSRAERRAREQQEKEEKENQEKQDEEKEKQSVTQDSEDQKQRWSRNLEDESGYRRSRYTSQTDSPTTPLPSPSTSSNFLYSTTQQNRLNGVISQTSSNSSQSKIMSKEMENNDGSEKAIDDDKDANDRQLSIRERRRPREKRRSTGVSYWSPDGDECDRKDDEKSNQHDRLTRLDSGSSTDSYGDRLLSRTSSYTRRENRLASLSKLDQDDGTKNYKKLYEEALAENEKLKAKLQEAQLEFTEVKSQLEKATQKQERISDKSSMLEMEKREKRALERKVSEMEEELKVLTELKSDNQRLKDENGALIRVISKLSK